MYAAVMRSVCLRLHVYDSISLCAFSLHSALPISLGDAFFSTPYAKAHEASLNQCQKLWLPGFNLGHDEAHDYHQNTEASTPSQDRPVRELP
jgi:hypothetical protein